MTTALAADLITQNCPREQGGVDKQRVRRRERWRRGEKVEGPIQREECEMGDSKVSIWEERSRFVESRDRWRGGIRGTSSGRGRRAQTVDFTPRHSDWKWCTCVSHTHTHTCCMTEAYKQTLVTSQGSRGAFSCCFCWPFPLDLLPPGGHQPAKVFGHGGGLKSHAPPT